MSEVCWFRLCAFLRDECGQDLVEYTLVAVIVALGSVASMNALAVDISAVFTSVTTTITGAL